MYKYKYIHFLFKLLLLFSFPFLLKKINFWVKILTKSLFFYLFVSSKFSKKRWSIFNKKIMKNSGCLFNLIIFLSLKIWNNIEHRGFNFLHQKSIEIICCIRLFIFLIEMAYIFVLFLKKSLIKNIILSLVL